MDVVISSSSLSSSGSSPPSCSSFLGTFAFRRILLIAAALEYLLNFALMVNGIWVRREGPSLSRGTPDNKKGAREKRGGRMQAVLLDKRRSAGFELGEKKKEGGDLE